MNRVDSDPAGAAKLVDDNWLGLARYFVAEAGEDGSVEEAPPLFRFTTGLASGFLNGVLRASLSSADEAARLVRESIEHFASRDVPWRWYVVTRSSPVELTAWLETGGLVRSTEMTSMAADLSDMRQEAMPSELEIREAIDPDGLEGFLAVRRGNLGLDERTIEGWRRAHGRAGLGGDRPLRTFVGYLEGVPVASSVLFVEDSVGGIYHVDVLPAARRRGYGGAMTGAACAAARVMGCGIIVLSGSALGRPVYERLGFRSFGVVAALVPPA